jgi:hypothetical protein
MLEDIFLSPHYWASFAILMAAGALLMRARLLDFKFIALGFISQYVVHAVMAFGIFSDIAIFCVLFWLLFVGTLTPWVQNQARTFATFARGRSERVARASEAILEKDQVWRSQLDGVEKWWVLAAKWFLLVYWACRLIFYPYIAGELDLTVRLEAGQDNRVLFFLGLAVFPAIAACVSVWIRKGYRFRVLDYAVLAIVVVGYLGTGSKVAILPVILIFFGAISFFKKPLREMRLWLVLAGVGGIVIGIRYIFFFPSTGLLELAQQALYRFVANTDSLEYLAAIGKAPEEYPFAGVGALAPMFLKPFGLAYDYSPGVWLHGTRFDQWAGFGPNPGLVMDYFGNLGWWGLLIPVFAGVYMLGWTRVGGAIGCSFIAITYQLFVDVTLFDVPFVFWAAVLAGLLLCAAVLRRPRASLAVQNLNARMSRYVPRRRATPFGKEPTDD